MYLTWSPGAVRFSFHSIYFFYLPLMSFALAPAFRLADWRKKVFVFSCSCYFCSTNLFNQLHIVLNRPTNHFIYAFTNCFNRSIYVSANNSFQPTTLFHHLSSTNSTNPFVFFTTLHLTTFIVGRR